MFKNLLFSLMLLFVSNVWAANDVIIPQEKPEFTDNIIDNLEYEKTSEEFLMFENKLKVNDFDNNTLDEFQTRLNEKDVSLDFVIKEIEKNAKFAQDALNAIGEAPKEGEIEEESISLMRDKYTASVNAFKSRLIEANLLKTEIDRLTVLINEARNRILIGDLVAEKNVLIHKDNFFSSFRDAGVFFIDVAFSPISWYKNLSVEEKEEMYSRGWYVAILFALIFAFGLYLRGFLIKKWGYRNVEDTPKYEQKIVVAIVTAIAYGVIPSLLIGGCLVWQLTNPSLVNSRFGVVLANVLYYLLYIILIRALVRVILTPWNGKWRLFNLSDEKAERLFNAITLSVILLGVAGCVRNIAEYFEVSSSLALLFEVAIDAIKAFVIVLLAVRFFGEEKKNDEDAANSDEEQKNDDNNINDEMSTSHKVILFTSVFAIGTFGISLFGYPGLATFIYNRFIISILLVGVFIVLRTLIYDLLKRSIILLAGSFKLRRKLLSKADLAMSLLVTPILAMVLAFFVLRIWGMPATFMIYAFKKLFFGFKVGGIEISIVAIVTGIVIFFISLALVRLIRTRLNKVLDKNVNMDLGVKHSLISGVNFIGIIFAVIIAIVAMGVDLSNLAVIAGALSVGIGFGLQDVIKNLVSGIIILFERPFKVGDWVIINGEEGKIKQINIRSTELETWTRRSVIIPNATLISSSLINLTHGNNWQRQSIAVGVAYDSDVDLVTKVLIDCAKSSKKVAKVPAPYVVFKDFADSSLNFELRYYISDIWNSWSASSDIRYEILKRFRQEGISIAYPQLVIHKSSEDTKIKGWQSNG